jgi:hypothetical protein
MTEAVATALEPRVARLEDLEAIRRLLLDYGTYIDTRDFERCSALFAEDAEYDVGFTTAIGPAGARAVMDSMVGDLMDPTPGRDFHVFTNVAIDLDGDSASARSFWQFVDADPAGHPRIAHFGHYDDSFVRCDDGQWRFQRRRALRDIGVPPEGF